VGQHHVYYEGDGQAKRSEADGKSADSVEGQMLGIIRSIRSDSQKPQASNHIRLQIMCHSRSLLADRQHGRSQAESDSDQSDGRCCGGKCAQTAVELSRASKRTQLTRDMREP